MSAGSNNRFAPSLTRLGTEALCLLAIDGLGGKLERLLVAGVRRLLAQTTPANTALVSHREDPKDLHTASSDESEPEKPLHGRAYRQ